MHSAAPEAAGRTPLGLRSGKREKQLENKTKEDECSCPLACQVGVGGMGVLLAFVLAFKAHCESKQNG